MFGVIKMRLANRIRRSKALPYYELYRFGEVPTLRIDDDAWIGAVAFLGKGFAFRPCTFVADSSATGAVE